MKAKRTANTERVGVSFIQLAFEEMGYSFREQPVSDYGIDAHVEIVNNEEATGRLLALQIKSGTSYFKETNENGVIFRQDMGHLNYWLNHSLPVIVVLYNPESKAAYWQVVTDENVTVTEKAWKMEIPFSQKVEAAHKKTFEELGGISVEELERISVDSKGKYTILSLRDVSHGTAKRYSANILVPEASTKSDIIQVVREVTNDLKYREYYRNDITKRQWSNKQAQVIFLFIYRTLDDVRTTSWIYRSLWIDKDLPSQFAPFRHDGDEIGDNIVFDRSQHYEMMQSIRVQHSLNKEAYLAELGKILKRVEVNVEKAIKLTNEYHSGTLDKNAYLRNMIEIEPILTKLYLQAGDIGLAPLECNDLRERFQSLMASAHNIVLPFSDNGLTTWKDDNRQHLVKKAIENYQQDKMRLEFELEKVH